MALTSKQEKFVQELVKGKSQRQAYKAAYDASKMKDSTIDRRASELFGNSEVKARYNELIQTGTKKALWTRERAINELVEMLDDSKYDKNYAGRYNAIKELNTLGALYPKESEVDINDPEFITEVLKKLPQEKLMEIISKL